MNLLDGRKTARLLEKKLALEVEELKKTCKREPKLAVVLVGSNPASLSYVKSKEKACGRVGILSEVLRIEETVSEKELIDLVRKLNEDKTVDGFIVQLPLPKHINENNILNEIDPNKDIDGMGLLNAGRLMNRQEGFTPATPMGVMMLLKHYNIETRGKHAVVVGRSNIVGSPMAKLLLNEDATVTIAHRYTKNLKELTKQADILVVATGVVNIVTADMVKEGVVVVDVGINRVDDKLVGDCDFENIKPKASLITPVPGGVGPMTINALMFNAVKAYKQNCKNT